MVLQQQQALRVFLLQEMFQIKYTDKQLLLQVLAAWQPLMQKDSYQNSLLT